MASGDEGNTAGEIWDEDAESSDLEFLTDSMQHQETNDIPQSQELSEHGMKRPGRRIGKEEEPDPEFLTMLYARQYQELRDLRNGRKGELQGLHDKTAELEEQYHEAWGALQTAEEELKKARYGRDCAERVTAKLEKQLEEWMLKSKDLTEDVLKLKLRLHDLRIEAATQKQEHEQTQKGLEEINNVLVEDAKNLQELIKIEKNSNITLVEFWKKEVKRFEGFELERQKFVNIVKELEKELEAKEREINTLKEQNTRLELDHDKSEREGELKIDWAFSLEAELSQFEEYDGVSEKPDHVLEAFIEDKATTKRKAMTIEDPAEVEHRSSVDSFKSRKEATGSKSGTKYPKTPSPKDRTGAANRRQVRSTSDIKYLPMSIKVDPPTPWSDSTNSGSEPSPLFLDEHDNGHWGHMHPDQPSPLSSIPGSQVVGRGVASSGSPPPRFPENTPETAMARSIEPLGSPVSLTRPGLSTESSKILSDVLKLNPDVPFPLRIARKPMDEHAVQAQITLHDTQTQRKSGSTQTSNETRASGTQTSSQMRDFETQTEGEVQAKLVNTPSKPTDTGINGPTTENASQSDNQIRRTASRNRSALFWCTLLLGLGCLSFFFGRKERLFWINANNITRQQVIVLRDEIWSGPMWIVKLGFFTENVLAIDRSLVG